MLPVGIGRLWFDSGWGLRCDVISNVIGLLEHLIYFGQTN
jgi:hypothetical protein